MRDVPACSQHDLVHAAGVSGDESAHIVHLRSKTTLHYSDVSQPAHARADLSPVSYVRVMALVQTTEFLPSELSHRFLYVVPLHLVHFTIAWHCHAPLQLLQLRLLSRHYFRNNRSTKHKVHVHKNNTRVVLIKWSLRLQQLSAVSEAGGWTPRSPGQQADV